mgnify:CR=1 FL=1
MKIYQSQNPSQTKKIGEKLGREILKEKPIKIGKIFALKGELGGGKTTFLKGMAKGLGIKEKVLSPTFLIVRRFEIKNKKSKFKNFYHIDFYRLKKAEEILKLNFKKIISNPGNIVAIEWADRFKKIIPAQASWITFRIKGENKREILIQNGKF